MAPELHEEFLSRSLFPAFPGESICQFPSIPFTLLNKWYYLSISDRSVAFARGVLKPVTGMQGKKFKDKAQTQREVAGPVADDMNIIESDGEQSGRSDQLTGPKRLTLD